MEEGLEELEERMEIEGMLPGPGFLVVSDNEEMGAVIGHWYTAEEVQSWIDSPEGRFIKHFGYRIVEYHPADMFVAPTNEGRG